MKVLFFTNTNVAIGAGIEKALINYVSDHGEDEVTVVQSQYYKIKRVDPGILNNLNVKIITIHDFEHSISFLRLHRITIPLYQVLLAFVVRYTKFYNRSTLRDVGNDDVVYLFKNEYWPLFRARIIIGSNHGQFAFDNSFTRVLSLFIRSGILYRGINAFHLFPKSAAMGKRMRKRLFLGPIGISTDKYVPQPRGQAINILFVGRLEEIKGIDIFVDISRRFKNESTFRFHIAGSGSFEAEIRKSNYDNVEYHGVLDEQELASLYGSCDIFLYPTRWDAFPTVIIEAASSGEYIVASDRLSGVYDDLLGRGFLEYTGLDADSIEARIRTLAKNIETVRKNAAYEHEYIAENYDNRVVIRNLYTNLHKLINESDSSVNVCQ
jgi:glycosyltransferase involved in cell wall biosynthesis